MKLQIDTDKKVLRLESDVNLGAFMVKLKVLFPDGAWKDYKLETNVDIQWTNPIYIDRWHKPTYPWWPTTIPITYTSGNAEMKGVLNNSMDHTDLLSISSGTYCVEV